MTSTDTQQPATVLRWRETRLTCANDDCQWGAYAWFLDDCVSCHVVLLVAGDCSRGDCVVHLSNHYIFLECELGRSLHATTSGGAEYCVQNYIEIWQYASFSCPCVQTAEYDDFVIIVFPFHFIRVLKEYPPSSSSSDQRPLAAVSACMPSYSYAYCVVHVTCNSSHGMCVSQSRPVGNGQPLQLRRSACNTDYVTCLLMPVLLCVQGGETVSIFASYTVHSICTSSLLRMHMPSFSFTIIMCRRFSQTTPLPVPPEMPLLPTWRPLSLCGSTCLTIHCPMMAGEQTSPSATDTHVSITTNLETLCGAYCVLLGCSTN